VNSVWAQKKLEAQLPKRGVDVHALLGVFVLHDFMTEKTASLTQ